MSHLKLPKRVMHTIGLSIMTLSVLALSSANSVSAIGLTFWDDSDTNVSGNKSCDVRGAYGAVMECSNSGYNVALTSTSTSAVNAGATKVHILFTNIPIIGGASNPTYDAFGEPQVDTTNAIFNGGGTDPYQLHFYIAGDSWCPGFHGLSNGGINQKDSAIAGYFSDNSNPSDFLPNGTLKAGSSRVTDFLISQNGHVPGYQTVPRYVNGSGYYRTSSTYCDSTIGSAYLNQVDVEPNDLFHQDGFPPTTWYVELTVRPSTLLLKDGTNTTQSASNDGNNFFYHTDASTGEAVLNCGDTSDGYDFSSCMGISNKFRVSEQGTPPGGVGFFQVSGAAAAQATNIYTGLKNYDTTFTNSKYDHPQGLTTAQNTAWQNDSNNHYTAVYRFGSDCSVVNNPGGWYHALLYDIDDSGANYDSSVNPATGDTQRAILIRTDSAGNTYYLKPAAYTQGRGLQQPSISGGVWGSLPSWSPSDSTNYSNTTISKKVDDAGSNNYYSLNFTANVGDKYELYLYDVRNDVVDQIGAPFDSVNYNNPCSAELAPSVAMSLAVGSTQYQPSAKVNVSATITNKDYLYAGAAYKRYFWIAAPGPIPNAYANQTPLTLTSGTGTAGLGGYDSGSTRQYVNPGQAVSTSDPALGGTWTAQIPAGTANGSWICTSLELKTSSPAPDPAGTVIDPPAIHCEPISTSAKPYFSVVGGDLAQGAGVNVSGCTTHKPSSTNSIYGANLGGPPNLYDGSGSQLAAVTLGTIQNFATDKYQTGAPSKTWLQSLTGAAPNAGGQGRILSFANYPQNGQYGSSIGLTNWCTPNYWNDVSTQITNSGANVLPNKDGLGNTINTYSIANLQSGVNTWSPPAGVSPVPPLIITGGTVPAGQHIILRATGTIVFTGSVLFGAATSVNTIPTFEALSGGSILVGNQVAELNGLYIAWSNLFLTCATSTGGIISGTTAVPAPASGGCNASLTIKGAVVANRAVVPNRTYGDDSGAQAPEAPAEVFFYNPQQWLAAPTTGGGVGKWQAVTSLPPIL